MYVRTLEIKGFMPFRDHFRINLRPQQIYGIQGTYNGDPISSNRAGKTSFVEAQVWCLYGESRAKKEIELIHEGEEAAQVTVELHDSISDRSIWITRSRTADNKGFLEIRGSEGEKKRVTQEEVNKIIGMSYDEFLFTAFFKQDDIDQFMEADPQTKKEILLNWIKEIDWAIFQVKTNALKLELQAEKTRLQTILDNLPTEEIDEEALIGETVEKEKQKEELNLELQGHSTRKSELQLQIRELRNLGAKKQEAVNLANKIQLLRNRRPDSGKMDAALTTLNTYLAQYPAITPDQHKDALLKRDGYISAIAGFNVEIRAIEKEITSTATTMTGVCPLLKQPCSRIEADPEATAKKQEQINSIKKKIERFEENKEKANRYVALYQKQVEWKQQKEKIELQLKAVADLESQIADLTNQRAAVLKSIPQDADERIQALQNEVYQIEDSQSSVQNLIADIDQWLGQTSEIIKQHKVAKERKEATEAQLREISIQLADAQYVEYMFGKNGIPSMELENSFKEIEEDANLILRKLKAPFHMEFDAVRELKDWEPACLACGEPFAKGEKTHRCTACDTPREKKKRDELSVTVFEQGMEKKFYMDSGGGKILMSVAIRLALTMLARKRKGTRWGSIYLDELFGKLDAKNRKMMGDLITSALMNELGFEQIFIISHDPNIQSSMAEQIIINRDDIQKVSEILM